MLSPSIFWVLSLAGSCLLCLYGWLRDDFSIILGQFISYYYIYLWNLNIKGIWHKVARPGAIRADAAARGRRHRRGPGHGRRGGLAVPQRRHPAVAPHLRVGRAGDIHPALRVPVAVLAPHARVAVPRRVLDNQPHRLTSTIVSYGCIRQDIVLIVGQSFGLVAYIRNLVIGHRARRPQSSPRANP